MYVTRYVRIVKYWLRIVSGDKSVYIGALYQDSLLKVDQSTRYSWTRSVRNVLFNCVFFRGLVQPRSCRKSYFLFIVQSESVWYFPARTCWRARLNESSRASFYRAYKDQFTFIPYLDVIHSKVFRISMTRLIVSSHRLKIETGRWQRPVTQRQNRTCIPCNKLDDEYHFLLECKTTKDIRMKCIPPYYWKIPSMLKCVQLLKCSAKTLNNLGKYVYNVFFFEILAAMLGHLNL